MTVTETKKEKGRLTRVGFDTGADALIDTETALLYGIRPGTVLSRGEFDRILDESDFNRAKSRALWYLDRGDHTEKGLYGKLVRAKFSPEVSARVTARLVELGLLDDLRFARNYTEKLIGANASRRQIYAKLCEKGISRELAKQTLDGLESDEISQIRSLIEKKYKTKLKDKESIRKVYASLIRRGFPFAGVRDVLKEYEEELAYTFEED